MPVMRARVPHFAIAALLAGGIAALSAPAALAAAQPTVEATTVDLCAKPGTQTVAGATVPIWGYAVGTAGSCALAGAPTLPGPTIVVDAGDAVTINVHNELGDNTSILFPGQQDLIPDYTGVGPGFSRSYTFTAGAPGTYLYESGANSARQVPMGLHGGLIVRPATAGQAYGPGTEYDVEATLVLSEIDPALNADPTGAGCPDESPGCRQQDYAPLYWLINGEAYPDTDIITAAAGQRVLLRVLNAGLDHHTMALLGAHQRIVAKDAHPEPHPFASVAETVASGQTADTIAVMPAGVARLPLYERQMRVVNGSSYPGGMLTFLQVP